ncbi:MAG: hypothetical protein LUC44_08550 [Prevotellaceae bacterium]|nr:hypothetical protein [Prevotellaceae bacterium]
MISLKGKTIFDFCKDKKMLGEIIDCEEKEIDDYKEYYEGCSQLVIMRDIRLYALRMHDTELFKAAEKAYVEAKEAWRKMVMEAEAEGFEID